MKPRPTRTAVYLLATQLDEQVETLHFPAFGAVRTVGTIVLSCKVQLKVLSLAAFSDCQGQLDSLCRSTPAQNPS